MNDQKTDHQLAGLFPFNLLCGDSVDSLTHICPSTRLISWNMFVNSVCVYVVIIVFTTFAADAADCSDDSSNVAKYICRPQHVQLPHTGM